MQTSFFGSSALKEEKTNKQTHSLPTVVYRSIDLKWKWDVDLHVNSCLTFPLENGHGLCNVLGTVFVDKCLRHAALSGISSPHFPAASPAQTR